MNRCSGPIEFLSWEKARKTFSFDSKLSQKCCKTYSKAAAEAPPLNNTFVFSEKPAPITKVITTIKIIIAIIKMANQPLIKLPFAAGHRPSQFLKAFRDSC
jgi:hypothetical protein